MHFDSVGSITDSKYGPNAFSLQDNTNVFTGTNGQADWVQFTDSVAPESTRRSVHLEHRHDDL